MGREPNLRQRMLSELQREYPALGRQRTIVTGGQGPYYSETYPIGEQYNPFASTNTISVFPMGQALSSHDQKQLIGGEMLHLLGGHNLRTGRPNDPGWLNLKNAFLNTLTPEQLTADRFQYRRDLASGNETRDFGRWMNQSQLEAYLRPGLFPISDPRASGQEWLNSYTPEQFSLRDRMLQYLRQ